jgi:penicillin G amidase
MLALQTDVYSAFDRFCAQHFVYAIDHTPNASPRTRQAAEILRDWSGKMDVDAAAPTIATKARGELWRMLLEPKLGGEWHDYHWWMSSVALENILTRQPQRWLPSGFSDWNDFLSAAVEHAVANEDAPKKLSAWTWGDVSHLVLQHPVLGQVPIVRRWSGPGEVPQAGNGFTVKQVGRGFGPSERMTVDFANLDASTFNLVTGESGHLLSPNYMDQWKAWYDGTTFTFQFSEQAVGHSRRHELRLVPAR